MNILWAVIYLLIGLPWIRYAAEKQLELYGFTWHFYVMVILNWLLWPVAVVVWLARNRP